MNIPKSREVYYALAPRERLCGQVSDAARGSDCFLMVPSKRTMFSGKNGTTPQTKADG